MGKKLQLNTVIQILIGLIFLFSGIFKALDSQEFARIIAGYGFVWGGYLSPIIAGLEVILGLCLIFRIYRKHTALAALIITSVFTALYIYGFFVKGMQDCGCMGPLLNIPPALSFVRNIFIISGSYWLWKHSDYLQPNDTKLKLWVIYIVAGFTFAFAGYTLAKPVIDKNNISTGERTDLNFLKPFHPLIGQGISLVFIFDTNCIKCWNVSANIKSIKSIPAFNNLIGITLPNENINEYVKKIQPNFNIYRYPSPAIYSVIKQFPVLIIIKDGRIEQILNYGEIPNGNILKNILHQQNLISNLN